MKRQCIVILLLSLAGASALAQPLPMASFRFFQSADSPPLTLKEIAREGRVSIFQVSESISDGTRALFALCNFAEFAQARGFSHIAVMAPQTGEDKYALGLFHSEQDDLAETFGEMLDKARLLGARPGSVTKILPLCPKKPPK